MSLNSLHVAAAFISRYFISSHVLHVEVNECACAERAHVCTIIFPGGPISHYVASSSLSCRFHLFIQFAIPYFCFDNFVGIGDSDRSRDDVVGIETFEFLFIYSASTNYKQLC